MTTQPALASFSRSACWAVPASHPPTLNRTTGLWLCRDSVIWVTTGLPSQPCTHTLSRQHTHQHEHRQRNMRSSTNITGIYCAQSETNRDKWESSHAFRHNGCCFTLQPEHDSDTFVSFSLHVGGTYNWCEPHLWLTQDQPLYQTQ